jgi:hypothetical protein
MAIAARMTTMSSSKPKSGGDTRVAAARNGRRVGAPCKTGKPMMRVLTMRISDEADISLRAWAEAVGVRRTDIARQAVERWLAENADRLR